MRACGMLCLLLSAGCFGSSSTTFPPGLEPLEANTAPQSPPAGEDMFPEGVNIVTGTDGHAWAHGRGYIDAPCAAVWAATQDPMVVADRLGTDVQSWDLDVEPEYDRSFVIYYTVHDTIDVEWEETWRLGMIDGSAGAPELAMARYQKTFGFNLIHEIEGSVVVRRVDDATCEVELIRHLDAYMAGEADVRRYVGDMYASLLARAHDQPLPE